VSVLEIGRVCLKVSGRDKGKRCVIVGLIDRNYVLITGPKSVSGIRRRRVNVNHLRFLDEKLEIPSGASDEEVAEAFNQIRDMG
jgi:large subunit ribosomal protein L14e